MKFRGRSSACAQGSRSPSQKPQSAGTFRHSGALETAGENADTQPSRRPVTHNDTTRHEARQPRYHRRTPSSAMSENCRCNQLIWTAAVHWCETVRRIVGVS